MPAFAAEYADCPTDPISPAPEDVFTMRASTGAPDAFASSRQCAAAWRATQKWPFRCTRTTASHSSSEALANIRSRTNPCVVHHDVEPAERRTPQVDHRP